MDLQLRLVVMVLLAVELVVEFLAAALVIAILLSADGGVLVVLRAVQLVLLVLGTQQLSGFGWLTPALLQGYLMNVGQDAGSPGKRRNLLRPNNRVSIMASSQEQKST